MLKRICKKCDKPVIGYNLLCKEHASYYYSAAGQQEMAESLHERRFLGEYRDETLVWVRKRQENIRNHAIRIEGNFRAMEKAGTIKRRPKLRIREMTAYVKELQAAARMQNRSTIC